MLNAGWNVIQFGNHVQVSEMGGAGWHSGDNNGSGKLFACAQKFNAVNGAF